MYQNDQHYIDFEKGLVYSKRYNRILGGINASGFIIFQEKQKQLYIHRYIYEEYYKIKLKQSQVIIHINGNKTDNRIKNLKLVNTNEVSKKKCKFEMEGGKYVCAIVINSKKYHIKYCESYNDARLLYNKVNKYISTNNFTDMDLKKYIKNIR